MDDNKLLRYSRHILLEPFGLEAQAKLDSATALVVGAGGLGSACLMYLASAGVGRLVVADGDVVDLTNLQRQVIHRESTIGTNKAMSAKQTIAEINSTVVVEAVTSRVDDATLQVLVQSADVVLDCTDNFPTRHAINRVCYRNGKALVSGAAIRFDGQLTGFDFRRHGGPCYACLFPEGNEIDEERCAVMGVFAPLVGVIGAMQAACAIQMLTGGASDGELSKDETTGRLHMFDARTMNWRVVRFHRDPACHLCASGRHNVGQSEEVEHV